MQYRHGDVMVERVEAPSGELGKSLPHTTLAHGEVTGHSHRISERSTAKLYERPRDLILEVTAETATLVHEEHGAIELPTGFYRVWRQREYSPEAIRIIAD